MESDYRTVMREEFISKKMGLLEDLQDMKMEAEEKKRKEMRKKKKLWESINDLHCHISNRDHFQNYVVLHVTLSKIRKYCQYSTLFNYLFSYRF